jgi:hypothetical protein
MAVTVLYLFALAVCLIGFLNVSRISKGKPTISEALEAEMRKNRKTDSRYWSPHD